MYLLPHPRWLLCSALTLAISPTWANPTDNPSTPTKTLFEALPPNLGELQVTPSRIPIQQTTLITATLRIPNTIKPETLVLRRLNHGGEKPLATLTSFHDDGQQGDNSANDGVYTTQTTLSAKRPGNIRLDALATFKQGTEQQQVTSFVETVIAKADVSANQAYVAVDGANVIFRDKTGHTLREEAEQTSSEPTTSPRRNAQTKAEVTFKQQAAIVSPDKSHVGIIGSLQSVAATDKEKITPVGWEFRYQNVGGTLWTKTIDNPERSFFLPGSSSLISEDGGCVLLIEVSENRDKPALTVYDPSGSIVLQEKPALYALEDAQISSNGHYILLKGLPLVPEQDLLNLIIIDVDNPSQRWLETYHASKVSSEEIRDNAQGGFDIWFNDRKQYSFPK